MKITEKYIYYLGHKTYCRIVGEESEKAPLLLLHGGPGSTHNYFEVLDRLAEEDNRQIVMYDQIGCGNSYLDGCKDLWTMETWMGELKAVREQLHLNKVHILGQSWGGMLLLEYICKHEHEGVKSIILSSTLPSSKMWEIEQYRMIAELPENMKAAIAEADAKNDYTGKDYLEAVDEYMLRHAAGKTSQFECVTRPKKSGTESYVCGWGPNEFTPAGTLKDYDVTEYLSEIKEPALVIDGGNDLCTPYIAKYMYDRIPNSRWELFRDCRHMCFVEDNERYVELLKEWLKTVE